jgi:putative nucleotidyltransferase with HDIG domain
MEVSKAVNSTLELSDLLNIIMELSKEVMQAEASSLMLIDEERGDLVFEVALGEKGEEVKKIRLPIGKGIAGWVAREGKPLLVPDVQKDPRFFKEADEKTRFKSRSILCVPLKVKEKIIGALEVINPIARESFDEGEIGLFEAIAREAAVAIENARLFKGLQELFLDTIKSLAAAIDAKDPYTHGHSERVTRASLAIAEQMNFSQEKLKMVQQASLLHDIGKIGIRDNVLQKPERLSNIEFDEIKKHPVIGANIVGSIRRLRDIVPGIRSHHERFGGGGYPDGRRGEEIDLIGRIISVADAFDAMTSDRPYRKRLSDEEALEKIKKGRNTQFDSQVVDAFIQAFKKGLIPR